MPLVAFWLALSLGVGALALILRAPIAGSRKALVVAMMLGAAALFTFGRPRLAPLMAGAPKVSPTDGYVGSGACASCHPGQHASWSRTFHRTMTQRASRDVVLAPLDVPFEVDGTRYTLSATSDDAVWVREGGAERERVLLTTGSHHMQGYQVAGAHGALRMLPFVYARDEAKLMARRDAFVQPPDAPAHDVRWNSNCIACHATAGQPGAADEGDGFDTRVGELGIACEACHGPGRAHIEQHRNPFGRIAFEGRGRPDLSVVNPARLPADRGSEVCGQCHSYAYPRDEDAFWRRGYTGVYRPGDVLAASRTILSPEVLADPRGPKLDTATGDLFWPDGAVRVGGREYNAMVLSACFLRGQGARKLACITCHSMHSSDPDDMLRRDMTPQAVCASCHAMPAGHSHHAPGSAGDACLSCHMPKTSYALRTAIRSHRIDSPGQHLGAGAPNACNLCHLDRSLSWTAATLAAWRADTAVLDEPGALPQSAVGLLSRDAAERALWADAMGDADALAASGSSWEAGILTRAAERDPYAVVRAIAARSLRHPHALPDAPGPARAKLDDATLDALTAHRDDHDITVAE